MGNGWNYGAYVNYADDRLKNGTSRNSTASVTNADNLCTEHYLYYKSHYNRLESLKVNTIQQASLTSP